MIEIGINQVSKNFGYKKVLNNVSFEVLKGNRVGIVGKNGSGKSTLFKIILKKEYPDTGNVDIRKYASIGYLEQIPSVVTTDVTTKDVLWESFSEISKLEDRMRSLEQEMEEEKDSRKLEKILHKYATIQEQFIAKNGYEVQEKLNRVIIGFDLFDMLEKPYNILSGGQKTIINLAKLMLTQPDILLLDEPTNHLDMKMLRWLEAYLIKYQGTIIIISHDRYFLDRVTNKTVMIESGEAHLFHGNYSYSLIEKERILLLEFEQYKTQQKKISAMKLAIKRYRDWGNRGDNESFFKKAKELEKRLEKMTILDKPQVEKPEIPICFDSQRSSNEVLKVKNMGISFGQETIFSSLSCTIYY